MFDREYWRLARTVGVASVFGYSDQYSSSRAATMAVDGDTGSYWRTGNPTGAYIIVELAEAAAIENMRWYVGNATYYAKEFTVAGSNDGETFDNLFSGACTNNTGWQSFSWINETPYRYIRVTCDTPNNASRLYTYELEFGINEKKYYDQSYGKYIVAVFDGPVSAPVESDVSHFSVTAPMPTPSEYGGVPLQPTSRAVVSVIPHPDVANALLITLDTAERLDECWKPVVLAYDGAGSLTGYGRPVAAFDVEFEPQGIAYKGDQNDAEHIGFKSAHAAGELKRIYYNDYSGGAEHIELTSITATGTLTHVNDI